ncbi:hypothetical protein Glove_5g3 [Diversispora epigaea]|uniref:Uncharacterized protein n=1 Tax=Diversispora epigaea TaxID=1348612 RepID=A0A397JZA8_9GLOM|nr:hypothetical protein Glove_5g3 [Diversispora epigaea]
MESISNIETEELPEQEIVRLDENERNKEIDLRIGHRFGIIRTRLVHPNGSNRYEPPKKVDVNNHHDPKFPTESILDCDFTNAIRKIQMQIILELVVLNDNAAKTNRYQMPLSLFLVVDNNTLAAQALISMIQLSLINGFQNVQKIQ